MAYDISKDVVLKAWDNGDGLQAGIYQYNEGEKKFQVGPRSIIKKNGEMSFMKVGRLSMEEAIWLQNVITEAITLMADAPIAEDDVVEE